MSILTDVLKYIPTTTDDVFTIEAVEANVCLHIDTALGVLRQNGIGLDVITSGNKDADWDDFFGNDDSEAVYKSFAKSYVYIKAQLLFDTPQPSVVTLMEKAAEEFLWRARLEFDNGT